MRSQLQIRTLAEENSSSFINGGRSRKMRRIKQISVKGLFGTLDHVIPLKMEDRITIIYGSNGIGKTITLQLLDALFNQRRGDLRKVPFDEFRVDFSDASSLRVTKSQRRETNSQDQPSRELHFHFAEAEKIEQLYTYTLNDIPYQTASEYTLLPGIDTVMPELIYLESGKWVNRFTGEFFSPQDVSESFRERLNLSKDPAWLNDLLQSMPLRFIGTQRLLSLTQYKRGGVIPEVGMEPTVNKYAEELATAIKQRRDKFGSISQVLDKTFPQRVLERQKSMPEHELRQRLAEQEKKRSRLMAAGLLDQDRSSAFQMGDQVEESQKKMLSVYVEDVDQKLGALDDISEKINLLNKIIANKQYAYKEMTVNKDAGFTFTSQDNQVVPLNKLSLGEQNELVLFYDLLFKTPPGSLLLIDEPETSLHIVWQHEFIKDVRDIIALTDLDAIIATHSPSLVHNDWDLTVGLEGKQA